MELKGVLYLIPTPLGDIDPALVIPAGVLELLPTIKRFVVEELRSARRYLSRAGLKGRLDTVELYELNEHTADSEIVSYLNLFNDGTSVGMISEAGLPAVADPGARLVELCHENGIKVIPLVGPSSLMMALMSSGKNGQSFAFNGYLPIKSDDRKSKIKQLEKLSKSFGQSQIIIETPYRNNALMADFLQVCSPSTKLTVAMNISMDDEFIKTHTIEEWRRKPIEFNKKPAVFIL